MSATATATVTASPLSTTTYTLAGTLSPSGCASTATITVTVLNPGTIGSAQANCGVFTPATLGSISDASGTAGITYQWPIIHNFGSGWVWKYYFGNGNHLFSGQYNNVHLVQEGGNRRGIIAEQLIRSRSL